MDSTICEQSKRHAFDSYCKKVAKNELCDYYNEIQEILEIEANFSELSKREFDQLSTASTTDEYFTTEDTINVLGNEIIIHDTKITKILQNLPEHKRDIILLYYFLNLNDREIGEKLNMVRSTVQKRRSSTLKAIKQMMEGEKAYGNENHGE